MTQVGLGLGHAWICQFILYLMRICIYKNEINLKFVISKCLIDVYKRKSLTKMI